MAIERNGIVFFDLDEKDYNHPAFKALQGVSLGDVRFPFGFFLHEENGKKYVLPGTKDDLLKRLRTVFPDYPAQSLTGSCTASAFQERCEGGCGQMGVEFKCKRIYDDPFQFFACACVNIS
jgi:hypothetical protein